MLLFRRTKSEKTENYKKMFVCFTIEATLAPNTNAVQRAREIPSIPMTANNVIQSNVITSATHNLDDFADDEFLNEIDLDQITEATNLSAERSNQRVNQIQSNQPPRRSMLLFDDMDDNDLLSIDSTIEQMAVPQNEVPQNQQHSESRASNATAGTASLNTSANASICSDNYRFKIRGLNLVTIKQLTESSSNDRIQRKCFIVKAYIDDIIQHARVSRHNKWKLCVLLTDRYSRNVSLEVIFNSDVLDKLSGISGREMNQLAEQREERPQIHEQMAHILTGLSKKLEEMNTFMKIAFIDGHNHPAVVELIAPAPVLERKLQEKIEYEKLI